MNVTGQAISIAPAHSAVEKSDTIYNENISYSNYTGNTPSSISLGTHYADADTIFVKAYIDNEYAQIWTRYALQKGDSQYGYIVSNRTTNNPHEVVLLILERSSSGALSVTPYKCNGSGTHKTVIEITGTSSADIGD